MNSALIPFGLKGNRMVSVGEVAAGLACDCACPACGEQLVAKQGLKRAHHFAHVASDVSCTYGAETAIHRMAKQCLLDAQRLHVPGLSWQETAVNDDGGALVESEPVCEPENVSFDYMVLEAAFDDFRPDAIGWVNDRPLLIEIAVRHHVERGKAERLARLQVACIEIDLSKVDPATISFGELQRLVLDEQRTKQWISHPRLGHVRELVRARLQERLAKSNVAVRERRRSQQQPKSRRRRPVTQASTPPVHSVTITNRWLACEHCKAAHKAGLYEDAMQSREFVCGRCGFTVGLDPSRMSAQHRR